MSVTLRADKLSCGYGNKPVLSDVSFELHTGEVTCLLGPNGVGKSTLFKTMLGFLPRLDGKFWVGEKDIQEYSREELAHFIAYVPQAHIPPFPFSVEDVVLMGRTACFQNSRSPGKADREKVDEILDSLGIFHLKERIYTRISGGERQMVLIARALAQEPQFLIMDEPASNLDFGNQMRLLEKVLDLKDGNIGIAMASHHPDHAFISSAKVILIQSDGQVLNGDCDDILTKKNLSAAYGIPVRILEVKDGGDVLKSCIMRLHQSERRIV